MSRRIETGSPAIVQEYYPDVQGISSTSRDISAGSASRLSAVRTVVSPGEKADGYIDRLLKYIPSEIIALYLAVENAIPPDVSTKDEHWKAHCIVALLSAICVPIYMSLVTRAAGKPLWSQVVISSIAFPIWVFAIGGPFEYLHHFINKIPADWYQQNRWIAAVVISFCTFLLGLYKPEAQLPTPVHAAA